jgi:hypothetical protein
MAIVRLEGVNKWKRKYLIETRTRDLPIYINGKQTYELNPKKLGLQIRQLHCESGRQIMWQVSSQSPVFWLRHEVHYWVVWLCAEASTVLRVVAADFFL